MGILRDLLRDGPLGWLILLLLIAAGGLVLLLMVEFAAAETRPVTLTVLDTTYEPSRTGVGVGPVTSGSGGGTAVVVTSSGPEYALKVEFEDGSRDFVDTNKRTLLAVEIGTQVTMNCVYGGVSGSILSCRL